MNKPITVPAHLSSEAIETRYRKANDPVERSHWHLIWLFAQGKTTKEIAEVTGSCPTWIRSLAHRSNDEGPQGLGDRRHSNPGGTFILSAEQQAQLHQALEEPPADGGLWTGPKVARLPRKPHGAPGASTAGLGVAQAAQLEQAGAAATPRHSRSCRPRSVENNLPEHLKAVQQAFPQATVELWATDEHRVGLKPILRRVWVRKGTRPRVAVQHRFPWLSLYSFVHPASGQTEWLLRPPVRADVFTLALAQFAQAVGAGAAKRILLVLDQAGWQTSKELMVPEGIHLLALFASFTRMAADVERLWPLSNEGVATQSLRSRDDLEAAQIQRCVVLQNQPEVIRSHTHFQWWPPSHSKHQ